MCRSRPCFSINLTCLLFLRCSTGKVKDIGDCNKRAFGKTEGASFDEGFKFNSKTKTAFFDAHSKSSALFFDSDYSFITYEKDLQILGKKFIKDFI